MSAEAPTDRPINVSGLSAPASDRAPDAAGAALVGSNSGKIIDEAGDVTEICVNGTDELSDEVPLRAANEASGVMATNPTCGGGGGSCVAFTARTLVGNGGANGGGGTGAGVGGTARLTYASVLTAVSTEELSTAGCEAAAVVESASITESAKAIVEFATDGRSVAELAIVVLLPAPGS